MSKALVPPQDKLLLSIEETAALLGIGRDLTYRLVMAIDPTTGKPPLPSFRIGRRRLVARHALDQFVVGRQV